MAPPEGGTAASRLWTAGSRIALAILLGAAAIGLHRATGGHEGRAPRASQAQTRLAVDPNSAPRAVLSALPHFGPSLVDRIVEERRRRPFSSPADLQRRVRGLGPAIVARVSPYLRFAAEAEAPPPGRAEELSPPPDPSGLSREPLVQLSH